MREPDTITKPRRVPSTARGRALRQAVLEAAERSFLTRGYHGTSVLGICQDVGASNGAFYQYFSDKEELFLELWTGLQTQMLEDLRRATDGGFSLKGRVEAAASALAELLHRERGPFQVFREAEFVAPRLSRSFHRSLEAELPGLIGMHSVHPAALGCLMLGAVYFNLVSRSVWEVEHHPLPTIVDLLLGGMAPRGSDPDHWRSPGWSPEAADVDEAPGERPLGKGERTRLRLLDAAEALFGTLGYHDCSTSKVAEAAGVGQGTVYRHFPSKAALLEELVRRTNRQLKAAVVRATRGRHPRVRIEALAMRAFLAFIGDHREMYRLVREAEFASQDLGRWYYLDIAETYRTALGPAITRGEIRPMDPLALGLAIMGVGHHLGLRWPVWESSPVPDEVLTDTLALMMWGVLGVEERRGGAGSAPYRPT